MRHYVIASHGGFSKGIYESIKIIIGEQAGVDIITAFIDGKNDSISKRNFGKNSIFR